MIVRFRFLFITTLTLLAISVHAQWTMDPTQNAPISVGNHGSQEIQTAPDGKGGAYFVWDDDRGQNETAEVYCQYLDANGNALWTAGGIKLSSFPGGQSDPRITSDSAGGAFICWEGSADTNTSREDVFAQHIAANGTLLWGASGINVSQSGEFDVLGAPYARLVADNVGGFFVAWDENVKIYIGRVNAAGTVLWKKGVTPFSVTQPRIVRSGDGGVIVAYNDARAGISGDFGNVYTQKVDSTGAILWGGDGAPACNHTSMQDTPDIVSDGSTGAIVAWEDFRSGSQYKVFAQHLNGSGAPTWITGSDSSGIPVCTGNDTQDDPVLADGLNGTAIVTWNDGRRDMYAQKLSATGSLLWGASGLQVTHLGFGIVQHEDIVGDGTGGVFAIWSDTRNLASNVDVFAQRISAAGAPLWTADGVAVSTAGHQQDNPILTADGKGNLIGAWLDARTTNSGYYYDLYAQKVSGNGALLDVRSQNENQPAAFALYHNYPNPFNPSTQIQFSVEKAGLTSLSVYNILGEEVARLFDGNAEPGKLYSVTFDAKNYSSGVYYYSVSANGANVMKSMVLIK